MRILSRYRLGWHEGIADIARRGCIPGRQRARRGQALLRRRICRDESVHLEGRVHRRLLGGRKVRDARQRFGNGRGRRAEGGRRWRRRRRQTIGGGRIRLGQGRRHAVLHDRRRAAPSVPIVPT